MTHPHTLWFTADRGRRFLVPDDAEVAAGGLALRTSLGRERSVDAVAVLPYEVTEEEAKAWSKAQLGTVLGEVRGKALDFVAELREKTAALREENRAAWERGAAGAPEDVRAAGEKVLDGLRELGQALRRAGGGGAPAPSPADATSSGESAPPEAETVPAAGPAEAPDASPAGENPFPDGVEGK